MLVKKGSTGNDVVLVQNRLNYLGYSCGSENGTFGSATDTAVRKFQRDYGLTVDGIVGNGTWSTMQNARPILKLNGISNHVSDVKNAQNRLLKLGYNYNPDSYGFFGTGTKNAAINFQSKNGLTADGIIGKGTWDKLYAADANVVVNDGYLRVGSRGTEVTTLQNRLNELGYNCGTADGVFGNGTKAAVAKFQSDYGLAADGIVGPKTQDALSGSCMTVKKGSKGKFVTQLQNRLNELGYNAGTADGVFGTGTYNAVKSFQENNALVADGIVGPKTWAELLSDKAKGPTMITNTIIRLGSTGYNVVWLQNRLLALNYYLGNSGADGVFGQATYSAVTQFQENNGLTVDGIVGENTWRALHSTSGTSNSIDSFGNTYYRKGRRGDDVRAIQQKLLDLGYNCGNAGADGIFGPSTYNAVVEFQRRNGLQQDGIVGRETYTALFSSDAIVADYTDSISGILKFGSKGEDVKTLQRRLIGLGYSCGRFGADGVFGDATYNAVIQFQLFNGLSADGIVGANTKAKLFSRNPVNYEDGKNGHWIGDNAPIYIYDGDTEIAINKMIEVAIGEVGYRTKKWYSKYGVWLRQPGAYWCNCFVSWCAHKVGISQKLVPEEAYTETSRNWFRRKNSWEQRGNGYKPKKGDCIFFLEGNPAGRTVNHIGLVRENSDGNTVKTVEGNLTCLDDSNYSEVRLCSYSLNDTLIVGYGNVRSVAAQLPQKVDPPEPITDPTKLYCGGEHYYDVNEHNLVYKKSTQHYVCSRCKYDIPSPRLEDKTILGIPEQMIVEALFCAYGNFLKLREDGELGDKPENIILNLNNGSYYMPEKMLRKIDEYRYNDNKGITEYSYKDSHKVYANELARFYTMLPETTWMNDLSVTYTMVNNNNIGVVNGFWEKLIAFIAGFFVPTQYQIIYNAYSLQNVSNPPEVLSALVQTLGPEYEIFSNILGGLGVITGTDTEIKVGDYVVQIADHSNWAGTQYTCQVVFNSDKKIKKFAFDKTYPPVIIA